MENEHSAGDQCSSMDGDESECPSSRSGEREREDEAAISLSGLSDDTLASIGDLEGLSTRLPAASRRFRDRAAAEDQLCFGTSPLGKPALRIFFWSRANDPALFSSFSYPRDASPMRPASFRYIRKRRRHLDYAGIPLEPEEKFKALRSLILEVYKRLGSCVDNVEYKVILEINDCAIELQANPDEVFVGFILRLTMPLSAVGTSAADASVSFGNPTPEVAFEFTDGAPAADGWPATDGTAVMKIESRMVHKTWSTNTSRTTLLFEAGDLNHRKSERFAALLWRRAMVGGISKATLTVLIKEGASDSLPLPVPSAQFTAAPDGTVAYSPFPQPITTLDGTRVHRWPCLVTFV